MREPSWRFFPFSRGLLAVALGVAIWGGTAMSFKPWARPAAPLRLEEGHFHDGLTGRDVPTASVVERLARADVVFLGEIHDRRSHRDFQVALVEALVERGGGLALGLEFFARDDQALLDELASGRRSELAFRSRIRRAGGYPYRELINLARERGVRLLGLNLPREVVSQVALDGWESLSARERARWPRPSEASPDYRRLVRKAYLEFEDHHKADFRHFLAAQTLWDSTMAESIRLYLDEKHAGPLVVVVGMMHVAYGLGIPSRLDAARAPQAVTVLPADGLEEEDGEFGRPVADYIWYPERLALAQADDGSVPGGRRGLTP